MLWWSALAWGTADPSETHTESLLGIDASGALLVQRTTTHHDPTGEGADRRVADGCLRVSSTRPPQPLDQPTCDAARSNYPEAEAVDPPWPTEVRTDPLDPVLVALEHDGEARVLAWIGDLFDADRYANAALASHPPTIAWFARPEGHAMVLRYTEPDVFGNRLPRARWWAVKDVAAMHLASARYCIELRSGTPGAVTRDVAFEDEVRRRVGDRFMIVESPAVDHARAYPQVLYREGFDTTATALVAPWRTAADHAWTLQYADQPCMITVISPGR